MTHQKNASSKSKESIGEIIRSSFYWAIAFLAIIFLREWIVEARFKADVALLDGENSFEKRQSVLKLVKGCGLYLDTIPCYSLAGAPLANMNFREADLSYADLRGADLRGADLRGADLGDADLRGADLRDATFDSRTWLWNAQLDGAYLTWRGSLDTSMFSVDDLDGAIFDSDSVSLEQEIDLQKKGAIIQHF